MHRLAPRHVNVVFASKRCHAWHNGPLALLLRVQARNEARAFKEIDSYMEALGVQAAREALPQLVACASTASITSVTSSASESMQPAVG